MRAAGNLSHFSDPFTCLKSVVSLLDSMQIGVMVLSESGAIKLINDTLVRQFNIKDRIINYSAVFQFVDRDSAEILCRLWKQAQMAGYASQKIGDLNTLSGKKLIANVQIDKIEAESTCYWVTFKFRQKQFVKRGIDIANLFLNVSSNLSEGIYRGVPNKGLVYINNSFAELFGYPNKNELLKVKPLDFFSNPAELSRLEQLMKREKCIKNETILFTRKDKSKFWGLVNCVITKQNDDTFFDGTIIDITDRKNSEQLLQEKNNELQKINDQMDKFLYSASHDIRSPMTSIMGIVNIMRMEIDESNHAYLDKIDNSLQKLDYFIKEVMEFSQNARMRHKSQRINFKELVQEVFERLNGARSGADLQIHVDNRYFFYSDYERLRIVLTDLLKNSLQYIDPEKKRHKVGLHIEVTPEKSIIYVGDNGIGIRKAHLDKVFDMFYRATENTKGSGLGLYIVKEAVEKLNGTISIDSRPKIGTTVKVEIPNDSKGKLMSKKVVLAQ